MIERRVLGLNVWAVSFAWLSVLVFLPVRSTAAVVEGVVFSQSGPLPNAKVYAYRTFDDLIKGKPTFVSKPGEAPGFFRMRLPKRRFYFTAQSQVDGKVFFSYHGANPITVEDQSLWLPFMAVQRASRTVRRSQSTRLRGVVTFKGKPVPSAQVSLYSVEDVLFKGIGVRSANTGNKGAFEIEPEPGAYVVVARKRLGPRKMRPLKKGDFYCFYSENPVVIQPAKEIEIEIPCYPKEDPQSFIQKEMMQQIKRKNANAVRFHQKRQTLEGQGEIRGKVTDLSGEPKSRIFVMAYKTTKQRTFQMHTVRDNPTVIVQTERDGSYRMGVKEKGLYTVVARGKIGETPEPGELFGLYEGNVYHAVSIGKSRTREADIIVSPLLIEEDESQHQAKTSKTFANRSFADIVIREDVTLKGEISIMGTVVVGRQATLTIAPGTIIRFAGVDKNGDGVGDCELRVLGKLLVQGESTHPVRFTSLEKEPKPKDWSYVLLFASRGKSIIKYAIFEYAFTGVQAHFSGVVVSDSVFKRNAEGIRFGRAHVKIEHNEISKNTYGIRHHRLEENVEIVGNNIHHNEVGIFLVPSSQNIIDFSQEQYSADRKRKKQPIIKGNNIFGNSKYNYCLGERFRYDIVLKENWWGSARLNNIEEQIFDRLDDPLLGKVLVQPYLNIPARTKGERKAYP